ncbi:hypothetical protein [Pseudomonas sp. GL-B-19]|uniref:hypothetical protein n=1 Tax=Pseudomonas sp. GL-B-19 TaxID=2832393 RepID=UPI001CBE186A|nr:hypothetical protein [Pseudomonas sp. GL-B-19]
MYDDAKAQAFFVWHELLMNPKDRMSAQEQYDELIRLADNFREKEIIDLEERKTLIAVATLVYTRAVEGAGSSNRWQRKARVGSAD